MRGLLKIGMVAGLVALFGLAAKGLSTWWAGPDKHAAVSVVVVPPPAEQGGDIVPVRAYAALYAGRPRPLDRGPLLIDDGEVDLEQEKPRFTLRAGEADGRQFFVHAWVEMGNYVIYCESRPLPRLRPQEVGGEPGWVDMRNGQPLPTMRIAPHQVCET